MSGIQLPENVEHPGVPFSLECMMCDAGTDVSSMVKAVACGWQHIQYDDGPGWNYLGLCPTCAHEEPKP